MKKIVNSNLLRLNKTALNNTSFSKLAIIHRAFYSSTSFSANNIGNKPIKYRKVNFPSANDLFIHQKPSFFSTKLPPHTKLTLPNLSPSMETGTIVSWNKKEGDHVKAGESIASIETDKAVVDFEMTEEGYLAKILVPAGTKDIPLGTLIALLAEEKGDVAAFKSYSAADSQAPKQTPTTPAAQNTASTQSVENQQKRPETPVVKTSESSTRQFVSPLARNTANQLNINLSQVKGTGPNSRVIQQDVLEFSNNQTNQTTSSQSTAPQSVQTPQSTYQDFPVSQIRKVIADRLLLSKSTIPHYYLQGECNVDKLLAFRSKLNKASKIKISINDIIIKAAAIACMKVPEANSSWQGSSIRMYKQVDMSIAVQTDKGLITPIVFNADTKRIGEISAEVKILAEKAKSGTLKPNEFQGGTFTISNLGMMGITSFSAIINPPQSCILAVGGIEKRVVLDENSSNKDSPYKVVNMINTTMSCDHRTVDGAVGARWISEFRMLMEDPELMLL